MSHLRLNGGQLASLDHGGILDLHNRALEILPSEILLNEEVAKKVVVLDLSNNRFAELPADIDRLVNLKDLYLDGNKFRNLPSSLYRLSSLRSISLESNPFLEEELRELYFSSRAVPRTKGRDVTKVLEWLQAKGEGAGVNAGAAGKGQAERRSSRPASRPNYAANEQTSGKANSYDAYGENYDDDGARSKYYSSNASANPKPYDSKYDAADYSSQYADEEAAYERARAAARAAAAQEDRDRDRDRGYEDERYYDRQYPEDYERDRERDRDRDREAYNNNNYDYNRPSSNNPPLRPHPLDTSSQTPQSYDDYASPSNPSVKSPSGGSSAAAGVRSGVDTRSRDSPFYRDTSLKMESRGGISPATVQQSTNDGYRDAELRHQELLRNKQVGKGQSGGPFATYDRHADPFLYTPTHPVPPQHQTVPDYPAGKRIGSGSKERASPFDVDPAHRMPSRADRATPAPPLPARELSPAAVRSKQRTPSPFAVDQSHRLPNREEIVSPTFEASVYASQLQEKSIRERMTAQPKPTPFDVDRNLRMETRADRGEPTPAHAHAHLTHGQGPVRAFPTRGGPQASHDVPAGKAAGAHPGRAGAGNQSPFGIDPSLKMESRNTYFGVSSNSSSGSGSSGNSFQPKYENRSANQRSSVSQKGEVAASPFGTDDSLRMQQRADRLSDASTSSTAASNVARRRSGGVGVGGTPASPSSHHAPFGTDDNHAAPQQRRLPSEQPSYVSTSGMHAPWAANDQGPTEEARRRGGVAQGSMNPLANPQHAAETPYGTVPNQGNRFETTSHTQQQTVLDAHRSRHTPADKEYAHYEPTSSAAAAAARGNAFQTSGSNVIYGTNRPASGDRRQSLTSSSSSSSSSSSAAGPRGASYAAPYATGDSNTPQSGHQGGHLARREQKPTALW